MKFTVNDGKYFTNAILNCTLKGKYFTSSGVKSKNLGDYVYLELNDNELSIYNADETLALQQIMFVEGVETGSATIEASKLLKYLKKFGNNITITMTDLIRITGDNKSASLSIVVEHPHRNMINVFKNRVKDYAFDSTLGNYPAWSDRLKFNTKVIIETDRFIEAIDSCEIVGTGIYKLDFGEEFIISSIDDFSGFTSSFIVVNEGEESTVEFTSPIHKFFDKDELMGIVFSDDSPILFLGTDRKLFKAPFVNLLR